jgi:class 3 adenylate cyclase
MASVLFTDLVDSTATASRLGPDQAERLRQTHFGLLRGVIEATGGTEVKNLGDGLMVAFTSPSRALACATGMQQAIARHNERAHEPLGVRIGLGVGEAVEEDGDYFGDPVVEASRLCAAASGGQILTTDLVRAMVGRHAPQVFHPVGALQLKGIPEPVAAVEVRWEPLVTEGRVPLPSALLAGTRDALFGFFGRADELDRIGDAQKRAFTEPRLETVLVGGEAGIGKTSVIAQCATRAHAAGAAVLLGHCDEDLTVPYQPWIQALSHLVAHLGLDCVSSISPVHRAALARLVPELRDDRRTHADAADSDRVVLVHAVEMLLQAAAADTPIVLVLDDLHWADAASLHVLRHLVASAPQMAVLVLCTYRHTDLGPDHPLMALLADLHRQSGITRLRLGGLDDVETVELLTAVAGHELDDDAVQLAHSLRRETDGNPFFTGELLRHLGESGALYQGPNGRWVVDGELGAAPLPASIRDVVSRRVSRLGPEATRILSLAAVIGRDFDLEILAQVTERSEDELIDVLEAATTAAVVAERASTPGSYRFGHALIQRTLYEDLGAARRARTHQRVAEALEGKILDGGPSAPQSRNAELAHHWLAAIRPADHDKALHYTIQAADEALAALAPDDAIRWYRQALDRVVRQHEPHDELRCRLLVGLGTAQRQVGDADHRATIVEAVGIARRIEDADLLVAAVLAADRGIAGTSAADVEWVRATEAALEVVGPTDSRARARLLAVLSQAIHADEWERRRDLSTEAVEVARRIEDAATLLAILLVAYQHYGPEGLDCRLADTAEAIGLARRIGDDIGGCNALFHRIDACMQAADIAEVDQRIAELSTLARSVGLPLHLWQLSMSTSFRLLLEGRCDDAEAEANAGLAIGMAGGHPEAVLAYGAQLLEIRRHQGRLGEMVEFFGDLSTDALQAAGYRQLVGWVFSEGGRLDDAHALFAIDRATDFSEIPRDEGWLALTLCSASTAQVLDDVDACRVLYERLLPYERQIAAVYATTSGAVARTLGCLAAVLGRYDDAEAHLAVALEMHEHIQAPYWIASTQLDRRDLVVRRGGPDAPARARELGERVEEIALERGYLGLAARVAAASE